MNLPIVYYHPFAPWNASKSRQRYLMEAMSAHTRVIYLNPPVFSEKRFEVLCPSARQISPTLTVIDNAFGFRSSRLGRRMHRFAATQDAIWLHSLLKKLKIKHYAYWLSAPSPELTDGMDCDNLIYDCIDPCFDQETTEFDRCEREVASRARAVFCTAEILLERMQMMHPNPQLLPNACAPQDYASDSTASLPSPSSLAGRPRPIIGYMGSFDWRVDVATLTFAAQRLPNYTFALVGRVNSDQVQKVSELRALPNVIMPGSVSAEDGRAYTAAFDVGLVPFSSGYMGDAINPVKMYMYLLAGKPVVSTWIRECQRSAPYVFATRTPEEFVYAIQQAVSERNDDSRRRVEFAMQNTWEVRARTAAELLPDLLAQGRQ